MSDVIAVEGIGEIFGAKLKAAGIASVEALLEKGATRAGRQAIADETGISGGLILRWVNHADLFRIKGVERQFAELLEASGVDSVPELAQRVPANLAARMAEVNEARHLTRAVPPESVVAGWVEQARTMPRVVTH